MENEANIQQLMQTSWIKNILVLYSLFSLLKLYSIIVFCVYISYHLVWIYFVVISSQVWFRRVRNFTYLQYPFRQSCLLGQLFQIFCIWVLVYGKICLHRPKLMVFERRSHPFRPLWMMTITRSWGSNWRVVRQGVHWRWEIPLLEHFWKLNR